MTGSPNTNIVAYRIVRQAWQNPVTQCDDIEIHLEDGSVRQESMHPSYHWWNHPRFENAKVLPARTA